MQQKLHRNQVENLQHGSKPEASDHFSLVPFTGSLRKADSIFNDVLTLRLVVEV